MKESRAAYKLIDQLRLQAHPEEEASHPIWVEIRLLRASQCQLEFGSEGLESPFLTFECPIAVLSDPLQGFSVQFSSSDGSCQLLARADSICVEYRRKGLRPMRSHLDILEYREAILRLQTASSSMLI